MISDDKSRSVEVIRERSLRDGRKRPKSAKIGRRLEKQKEEKEHIRAMAIRQIRTIGDDILRKECKPVKEVTPRIAELIDDMFETMYEANGVGLAAPQVGILKQIVVIDVDDGNQYVLINPEIIEESGSQTGHEGCLSVPGKSGIVTRPNHVKVRAYDEEMQQFELEGEELLARAICHECAHLHGDLYVDHVEGELMDVATGEEEEN